MEQTVQAIVHIETQSSLQMVDMNMVPLEHKQLAFDDGHTSKVVVADYTGKGKCVVEDVKLVEEVTYLV